MKNDEEHELIALALMCVHQMQTIIDDHSHDLFLPEAEAAQFKAHVQEFLKAYTIIGHMADARGDVLWNMTVKCHMLWHLEPNACVLVVEPVS